MNDEDRTMEVRRAIRAAAPDLAAAVGCSAAEAENDIRAAIGPLDEFSKVPIAWSTPDGLVVLRKVAP